MADKRNGSNGVTAWDEDAERAVIGAVLLDNAALPRVHQRLAADDFGDLRHRSIWSAMLALGRRGSAIDTMLLEDELGERIKFMGASYLVDCISGCADAENVEHYAAIISTHAISRRVRELCGALAAERGVEGAELLQRALDQVGELARRALPRPTQAAPPPTAAEVLASDAFSVAQATYPSGFAALDALIDGGCKARQLTVIAAPTGAGKTGLILEFARYLARQRPVVYFATELDQAESAARVAAQALNVRPSEILSLQADPAAAADAVLELPLYVVELDGGGPTAALFKIRETAAAVRAANAGATPAIVVDFLQGLSEDDPDGKRLSVSMVANELRRIARDLDVPVLAVSTVSRAYYGQNRKAMDGEDDPRAWLAAAKESGDIEYAAAVFMYLDTASEVGPTGESAARLIVAKSRRGRAGFVGLRFHGPTGRFFESLSSIEVFGRARRDGMDDQAVLDVVARRPPMVLNELRRNVPGLRAVTVDEVVTRLLLAGRLAYRDQLAMDSSGRRRGVRLVVLPDGEGQEAADA